MQYRRGGMLLAMPLAGEGDFRGDDHRAAEIGASLAFIFRSYVHFALPDDIDGEAK